MSTRERPDTPDELRELCRNAQDRASRLQAENTRLRQAVILGLRPAPLAKDGDEDAAFDTTRFGPGACANCRFFRWKADDEAGTLWGKCDNLKVHESAQVSGAGFFRMLASNKRVPWASIEEATEILELKVSEAFGCRFFEQADWMPVVTAAEAQTQP